MIASDTRDWVQEKADKANYNASDLMGWCAIAAAELHKRLRKAGIKSDIYLWDGFGAHCYCVVEDHVVDVTATQFRQYADQPIVIKHMKEAEVCDFHTGDKVFSSPRELRVYQKEHRWPSQQIAYA